MQQSCHEIPILQLSLCKMTRSLCQVLGGQVCNSSYCTVSQERMGLPVAFCIHLQWEEEQNQDCAVAGINSWTEKELGNPTAVREGGVEALLGRWLSSRTSLTARRLWCWLATWVLLHSNWLMPLGLRRYPILHKTILTLSWCTDTRLSVAGSSERCPCQLPPSCLTHQAHVCTWKGKVEFGRTVPAKTTRACKERRALVAGVGNMSPKSLVRWQLQMPWLHIRFDMGSREEIQQNKGT